MGEANNDRKSMMMLIASMLIYGTIGIFRRHIPFSSGMLAFSRGLIGGVFILLFMLARGVPLRFGIGRGSLAALAFSGALMGINWILLFEAYNYTSVAVATLCYYMQPTFMVLLSPLVFGERLTLKKTVCAAVAVAGMALVSGLTGGAGAGDPRGVACGLGAALFYTAVVIINKRVGKVDAYEKTVIQLFSAAIVLIPYLLVSGDAVGEGFDVRSALLLFVVGIVHTGIAYVLYFGSLDGLRAQTIALFGYIDPVSALLFSALLLGESLTPQGLLGAAMILGAAIVSEVRPARRAQ